MLNARALSRDDDNNRGRTIGRDSAIRTALASISGSTSNISCQVPSIAAEQSLLSQSAKQQQATDARMPLTSEVLSSDGNTGTADLHGTSSSSAIGGAPGPVVSTSTSASPRPQSRQGSTTTWEGEGDVNMGGVFEYVIEYLLRDFLLNVIPSDFVPRSPLARDTARSRSEERDTPEGNEDLENTGLSEREDPQTPQREQRQSPPQDEDHPRSRDNPPNRRSLC